MDLDLSSANYIQAERILRIETPLGPDVLLPERMEMHEAVNDLFQLSIAVRSKRTDLKPDELVGKLVDVSLETGLGVRRTWNGLVIELTEGPPVTRGLRAYHLNIVPQHWLMTQKSDCRIWLDKTSVEVAQILCSEHGLQAPVTDGVIEDPKPQHYSVQFNETDLAYMTRRLEEDGLFYWFEHEGGAPGAVAAKHTLHVAADKVGYTEGPETDVRFAMGSTDRNHISKFEKKFRFVPGKRSSADWNFLTPSGVPGGETPSLVKLPLNDKYDLYEYPAIGGYGSDNASEGISGDRVEKQSKLRMQAAEVEHEKIEGASTIRTLAPGRRLKPYDVANPLNVFEEHVVAQIIHTARDRSYETNEAELEYTNRFIALPARVPATPHRTTPRPRIDGTQVAIIAGPKGEEIHPDEYGRVKLWFPWDRRAKKDGSDTCWVRVLQNWGGGGWGGQIVPRIGMEAIVSYLDGDPDRPVIIGLVPNTRQKVPYTLPANKTKSVFRTQTHKGDGFNELSFEDEKGLEEIYMHAQRDNRIHVGNSRTKRVDNNQAESVGHNKTIEVGNNHNEVIGGNMTLMVGPNILQKGVTMAMQVLRNKARDLLSSNLGAFTDKLGFLSDATMGEGNLVIGVGKNKAETVMVSSTEIVGAAKATTIGGGYQLTVGGVKNESVAVSTWEEVGQTKVTMVGHKYEIICGKSRIMMERDGTITMEGVKLIINKKERVTVKAGKIHMN